MKKIIFFLIILFVHVSCDTSRNNDNAKGSKEIILYIDHYLDTAIGCCELLTYRTREGEHTDWEYFYNNISGFSYALGYRYKLRIKTTHIEDPPADESATKYELLEVISTESFDSNVSFPVLLKRDFNCWIMIENNIYSILGRIRIDFANDDVKTQLCNALTNTSIIKIIGLFHHSQDYSKYILDDILVE